MRLRAERCAATLLVVPFLAILASDPVRAAAAPWAPVGPGGGWVDQVLADPAVPGTIYAVASAAGSGLDRLYRSADRGDSWTWCGAELPSFGRISFDPVDGSTLYGILWQSGASQLFRSTDGCRHWEPISPETSALSAVVPVGHSTFYGLGDRRLVRSEDGGQSWSTILDEDLLFFRVEPADPETIYAVFVQDRALRKSEDGGVTWRQLSAPGRILLLAIAPAQPAWLYAVVRGSAVQDQVWVSHDGGETWVERTPPALPWSPLVLAVDPTDARTVWIAGLGAASVSRDGGETWQAAWAGLPPRGPRDPEPGVLSLAFDPFQPGTLYAGNQSGGVFRSVQGGRWQSGEQRGLTAGFVRFRLDPQVPGTVYLFGDTPFGPAAWTQDGGHTWARFPPSFFSPGRRIAADVAFDPTDPGALYAVSGTGLFRSADRGQSWTKRGRVPFEEMSLLFVGQALLAGGPGIWRSPDGGSSWRRVLAPVYTRPGGEDQLRRKVEGFLADPADARTVYANVLVEDDACRCTYRHLYRSRNGGTTWRLLAAGRLLGFGGRRGTELYAIRGFDLLRSADRGETWQPVHRIDGVSDLAIDPRHPQVLYAGTFAPPGILRSRDGGRTWKPFAAGFGPWGVTAVRSLGLRGGRLYAAPATGGLFARDLESE